MSEFQLSDLAATIAERANALPEKSYTASLLKQGPGYCARKFGEEAIEAVVAAVEGETTALTSEAADVIYHLLVMLHATGTPYQAVMAELSRRAGMSGHEEKASRGG